MYRVYTRHTEIALVAFALPLEMSPMTVKLLIIYVCRRDTYTQTTNIFQQSGLIASGVCLNMVC